MSDSAIDGGVAPGAHPLEAPRVCFVVASPLTARVFLRDLIDALSRRFLVHLVADFAPGAEMPDVVSHPIGIRRRVSIVDDVVALIALSRLFRTKKFLVVHSVTPKAGLLAMLSSKFVGVPIRVHMFTGQVWATRSGLSRHVLKLADVMIARCATNVLADSPSQREFLIEHGVVDRSRIRVLGSGGICGVDETRFHIDKQARASIRSELGIPSEAFVYLFVGRLTRDKGVLDLAAAFAQFNDPSSWLVVVGPDEDGLVYDLEQALGLSRARVRITGATDEPEKYMKAADVLCLPSYREGFGMTVIEAAACGLSAIVSSVYGLTDAVVDGKTGLFHRAGDVEGLARQMLIVRNDRDLRDRLGRSANERATELFSREGMARVWLDFYDEIVNSMTRSR